MREAIVLVAMQDAPKTHVQNKANLELQAKARKKKEDMFWEMSLEKASEEYIDAVYYHQMYSSEACWKNHPKVVTSELGKLSSESTKYYASKENIMIQVKAFGWNWCKHPWSKDGYKYSIFKLAQHLQYIIREEKSIEIPSEPPLHVPPKTRVGSIVYPNKYCCRAG